MQSTVRPNSAPPNDRTIRSETDEALLHREHEACRVLQTSTSDIDIVTVCRLFNFRDPNIPLEILSRRWSTRLDEHKLRKAKEILKRTVAVSLASPIWDWEWSPPVASSMKPGKVAKHVAEEMLTAFSKVSFPWLVERAMGILTASPVTELLDGISYTRNELCRRIKELDQPKEPYEAVKSELETQCPLAYRVYSTSVLNTDDVLDPSDALFPILNPIRDLFEDPELPLIPMLQRLELLAELHRNILEGADLQWNGLLLADFSFLGYINDHKPRQVAELLTNDDLSRCQKSLNDAFPWPVDGSVPRKL